MNLRLLPRTLVASAVRATKFGLYELAHLLMRPLWWCLSLVWWWISPRTRGRQRRVLLVANNEMLARFAGDVAAALADDDRLQLHFTRPPWVDHRVPTRRVVAASGLPWIGFLHALLTRWDLIINPDHFPSALFHPGIPKIFSAHGLFTGKRVRGQPYEYGPRARRWNGRPVYARIFASGDIEHQCARAFAPSLAEAITVTGSLQVDALLERNVHRAEIRESLGLAADRKTLIVMSSWGPNCLLRRDGARLFPHIQNLTEDYAVFLAAHRNNFFRGSSAGRDWNRFRTELGKRGIRVLTSHDDWWQYLVAADIALCDFTSLGLYYAQLIRPMVFVPFEERDFHPDSPLLQVYAISPKLRHPDQLRDLLAEAETGYPLDQLRGIAERTVSFRGAAADRVRAAVLDTLGLPACPTSRFSAPAPRA